jgi:hypothetical protein
VDQKFRGFVAETPIWLNFALKINLKRNFENIIIFDRLKKEIV